MTRYSLVARWSLTAMLVFAVLFGAVGQSLVRVEAASVSTPTASLVGEYLPDALPLAAPGDYDLSLTMTVPSSDLFPNINETVTFTIKVTNNGTIPVTGVIVEDVLPAGLTFKSADSNTYEPTTGKWVVGTVGAGLTTQLKINAVVVQTGPIENSAKIFQVDSGQNDPDTANNSASVVINPKLADLSITKIVDNPTPKKGDTVTFTITVSNAGPDIAENVTVKDKLPYGLVYQSDSDGGTTYDLDTGIWSVGTLLASGAGSSDTIDITASVDSDSLPTNIAEVWTSDQYDPDSTPGNGAPGEDDYATAPPSADLSLTKTIDDSSPDVGDTVTFTIKVNNIGPDMARDVSVKDLLSSLDFTYVSDTGGGNYDDTSGIWKIGDIAKGTSVSLNIVATANVNDPATNWAEIWKVTEYDPDSTPGDGSRNSDDDAGAPFADLSLTMSSNAPTYKYGDPVVFTLTVSNAGPARASQVEVVNKLPTGLEFVSYTGEGIYYNETGHWDVGLLQPSDSAVLKITALANFSGTVTNSAEVFYSKQDDPNSTPNNHSTTEDDDASVIVTTPALVKTVVITEVGWMGTQANISDEWIELYNQSKKPINLTGWQIRSFTSITSTPKIINFDANTCTNDCIIDPGQYFLLERNYDDVIKDIDADLIYPSVQLNNSGEMLILCAPYNISADNCKPTTPNLTTVAVDVVNLYEVGPKTPTPSPSTSNLWPAGSTSSYRSMERKNLLSNEDSTWFTHPAGAPRWGVDAKGNPINGTPKHDNWAFNVTATPRATATRTRTPTPFPQPAPVLVINEFLARPGHDWNQDGVVNTYDEFIEVMNAGKVSLNLASYKLDDYEQDAKGVEIKNGFTLPSRTLAPGQIAVFYASDTGIFLSDAGDTVRLVKASNYTVVDSYTYPAVRSLDLSWCRYTDGYGSWVGRCFPTPGQRNSLTGDLYPPQPGGGPSKVCLLPDNAPQEFLLAECEQGGLDIWNPSYWNSFPGEGEELRLWELFGKWMVSFQ